MRKIAINEPEDIQAVRDMLLARNETNISVEGPVREILETVRKNGDQAVSEYTRKFDCPDFNPDMIPVPRDDMFEALDAIPAEDRDIIAESVANVMDFHKRQMEQSWFTTKEDGTILGQMVRPMDVVGLYVPGGTGGDTPLVSSMIMNGVPAKVAGCPTLLACSPPTKDGGLNPYILATAALIGVDKMFRMGSAWAMAAMAYGTERVPRADMLAGPGNVFVATAKRMLVGQVGIDMIAGPSEVLVVADETANPAWAAADMLSQAEHDPMAAAILVTTSSDVASSVEAEIQSQLATLPRGDIAAKSIEDHGAIIQVPDLDTATDMINTIAPEHLELLIAAPWSVIGKIRHAGAIFMGHGTPEPVGDYFAGPNHVLPTNSTARFSSALSVQNFLKKSSIIQTPMDYVRKHGTKIARLARLEGLEAHARSVECRVKS